MSEEGNLARWGSPCVELSTKERDLLQAAEYQPLRSQTWLDESNRTKDEYAGHRALALAILTEALLCLGGEPRRLGRHENMEEERRLAAEWFNYRGDPWEAPNFTWVCMVCDIEPWMVIDAVNRLGPVALGRKLIHQTSLRGIKGGATLGGDL